MTTPVCNHNHGTGNTLTVVIACIIGIIVFLPCKSRSQDSLLKHKVFVGWYPWENQSDPIRLEVQFLQPRNTFYSGGIETYYTDRGNSSYRYKRFVFVPSIGYGKNLPFFRILTFKAAAKLSYLHFRESNNRYWNQDYSYRSMYGVFLGPDLGLEVRVLKLKRMQFSLRTNINVGFGLKKEKNIVNYSNYSSYRNDWGFDAIGLIDFGVGVKF
jgi:hypothetical protein